MPSPVGFQAKKLSFPGSLANVNPHRSQPHNPSLCYLLYVNDAHAPKVPVDKGLFTTSGGSTGRLMPVPRHEGSFSAWNPLVSAERRERPPRARSEPISQGRWATLYDAGDNRVNTTCRCWPSCT